MTGSIDTGKSTLKLLARAGIAAAIAVSVTACSSSGDEDTTQTTEPGPPRTLRVPDDHGTIQAAVDAARPGDLVLVSPGTYRESVTVETERITIRGTNRDQVVLDGLATPLPASDKL
mgnify:CR=1 FL=1